MLENTPIYSALKNYSRQAILRLHMPGHAGKDISLKKSKFNALFPFDVTEVPGMDNLHLPNGIIKQSQKLMAHAYGAAESFYLVNGATSGIQALFLAVGGEGKKVLLPRNAHCSFYSGMVLSGTIPVYIPVQVEPELGIALGVIAEDVRDTMQKNADIEAVFLTSPSYYGTTIDIYTIAGIVHDKEKKLLIDEAHGAHFPFSKVFPQSALSSNADAVVNSLHKTLPVLNQGAVLHVASSLAGDDRIRRAVNLLTTTSPSYPIMASMELARYYMEINGDWLLDRAYHLSLQYRKKINQIPGLIAYERELITIPGVVALDPLKLLVSVRGTNLNGYEFAQLLRENYRIQVELADNNFILAMFSLFHEADTWENFYQAVKAVAGNYSASGKQILKTCAAPLPKVMVSPRQAYIAPLRRVALKDAINQIAGEMITAYPPGIPCILPGEVISHEIIEYLMYLKQSGASIQGPQDITMQYVNIIDN
ncbi:MAG: aminotransferase class I/II-fold pyridoxal phosphate-dependent enzyme [Syntrophomonadaceae bacterium]